MRTGQSGLPVRLMSSGVSKRPSFPADRASTSSSVHRIRRGVPHASFVCSRLSSCSRTRSLTVGQRLQMAAYSNEALTSFCARISERHGTRPSTASVMEPEPARTPRTRRWLRCRPTESGRHSPTSRAGGVLATLSAIPSRIGNARAVRDIPLPGVLQWDALRGSAASSRIQSHQKNHTLPLVRLAARASMLPTPWSTMS